MITPATNQMLHDTANRIFIRADCVGAVRRQTSALLATAFLRKNSRPCVHGTCKISRVQDSFSFNKNKEVKAPLTKNTREHLETGRKDKYLREKSIKVYNGRTRGRIQANCIPLLWQLMPNFRESRLAFNRLGSR
jgi:hypothetical protein